MIRIILLLCSLLLFSCSAKKSITTQSETQTEITKSTITKEVDSVKIAEYSNAINSLLENMDISIKRYSEIQLPDEIPKLREEINISSQKQSTQNIDNAKYTDSYRDRKSAEEQNIKVLEELQTKELNSVGGNNTLLYATLFLNIITLAILIYIAYKRL